MPRPSPFDYAPESLPGSERAPAYEPADPPPPVVPALPRRPVVVGPLPLADRARSAAKLMLHPNSPDFVVAPVLAAILPHLRAARADGQAEAATLVRALLAKLPRCQSCASTVLRANYEWPSGHVRYLCWTCSSGLPPDAVAEVAWAGEVTALIGWLAELAPNKTTAGDAPTSPAEASPGMAPGGNENP